MKRYIWTRLVTAALCVNAKYCKKHKKIKYYATVGGRKRQGRKEGRRANSVNWCWMDFKIMLGEKYQGQKNVYLYLYYDSFFVKMRENKENISVSPHSWGGKT